jgi:pSer/pThr/pTyr-binding forkhead associated (FHA) protein
MSDAKLIFNGNEHSVKEERTSLGRSSDNAVSFSEDSNVSRYHAEIESGSGGEYFLTDLGSANGTTLNGHPVHGSERLSNGDEIELGGSSRLRFEISKKAEEKQAETTTPSVSAPSATASVAAAASIPASPENAIAGSNMLLIGIGATCLIVAVVVVGAAAFYFTRGSTCETKAAIVSPESGDTIIGSTDIELDVTNSGCVGSATFKIDGAEFATVDSPPFSAEIDAKEYPDLADGFDHAIAVELKDLKGNAIGAATPIMLAFETREVEKPPTDTKPVPTNNSQPTPIGKTADLSLIDIQEMSKRLVTQFSGKFSYNVSNKDFLQEVRKRTADYAQDGYFDRASRYRDAINVAYVREQNVDAALGFMIAMSRSKFVADKQGSDEGLWRMSNEFVTANAYNGSCGSETLSDPSQNCAAKASALYMKAIVYGVFDGDPVYSAVVFGKSPQDAGAWKASLPPNRSDIWNVAKTPQEREQLVRFFAAGIVAENPQRFGLKKDRPLSELYRLTM